ncbi:LOW QUALITY PROTEIN: hypothetical protein N5P37_008390 [Trichoderma harzianum]|nr:LOW QUALITY PROTEIN: hypothetical protein N5P37_008390 [Trichoderma harzianum]
MNVAEYEMLITGLAPYSFAYFRQVNSSSRSVRVSIRTQFYQYEAEAAVWLSVVLRRNQPDNVAKFITQYRLRSEWSLDGGKSQLRMSRLWSYFSLLFFFAPESFFFFFPFPSGTCWDP